MWTLVKYSSWGVLASFSSIVEGGHTSHLNLIWRLLSRLSSWAGWPQSYNKRCRHREREEDERKEGKKHLTLALMACGYKCKGSKLIGGWMQQLNNVGGFFIHSLLQTESWTVEWNGVLFCHWEKPFWPIIIISQFIMQILSIVFESAFRLNAYFVPMLPLLGISHGVP